MREREEKTYTAVDTILSFFYDFDNIAVYIRIHNRTEAGMQAVQSAIS